MDNLVDALMMMIYVVPINLRRFGGSLYVKRFAQGSQCTLSPAQQTSTISDLMRQEKRTNATEKQQDEIIDHNDTNENPLIQAMPNKRVEEALQKRLSEVALLQTKQCFHKNIDLTTNTCYPLILQLVGLVEEPPFQKHDKCLFPMYQMIRLCVQPVLASQFFI